MKSLNPSFFLYTFGDDQAFHARPIIPCKNNSSDMKE